MPSPSVLRWAGRSFNRSRLAATRSPHRDVHVIRMATTKTVKPSTKTTAKASTRVSVKASAHHQLWKVECSPECGFLARNHDKDELAQFVTLHGKQSHGTTFSRKDVDAMMRSA